MSRNDSTSLRHIESDFRQTIVLVCLSLERGWTYTDGFVFVNVLLFLEEEEETEQYDFV